MVVLRLSPERGASGSKGSAILGCLGDHLEGQLGGEVREWVNFRTCGAFQRAIVFR